MIALYLLLVGFLLTMELIGVVIGSPWLAGMSGIAMTIITAAWLEGSEKRLEKSRERE